MPEVQPDVWSDDVTPLTPEELEWIDAVDICPTKESVAGLYAEALYERLRSAPAPGITVTEAGTGPFWEALNARIISRWSKTALLAVKERAWEILEDIPRDIE